ncbi:Threonine/homoserine efflux transporter RhtA [Ferrimonas sediminum]|uniref:Threonine/homoserine efflux transporter RhtA n=1 Tax=Ferrimonas sediminum TaxID=718193 RepID=A0A1G8KTN8_9GAMM|nr:DMT family transporter [Ferrimonas sediminum]SDI46280.1 Threonine/homoserine efflux transporter RhtA [Ferrimonas sediminum]
MTPLLQLHLAVLLFGGTALFSNLLPLPATDITAFRTAIASVVLSLFVARRRGHLKLRQWQDYGIVLGLGIIVGLHWVTYFAAMQLSNVAIGMIAFFTYPVMTVIAEPLFNRQSIHRRDLLSGLVVLAGIALLIPAPSLDNDITTGVLLGTISAALFTARNLLQKRYFSGYDGPTTMAYQTGVAAVMLLPFVSHQPLSLPGGDLGLLLLLAVVFTALPHALMSQSLRHLSAKTVGLVGCLQPLYGVSLAAVLLAQWPNWQTLVGGTLVVCTALVETHLQSTAKNQK